MFIFKHCKTFQFYCCCIFSHPSIKCTIQQQLLYFTSQRNHQIFKSCFDIKLATKCALICVGETVRGFILVCFILFFSQSAQHHIHHLSFFSYLHTSCRWPRPGWWTPTRAAGRGSRRSSRWSRWTRSSLPLHSRKVSRQSIPGLLQSTLPSPAPTRQWSCNNWFFFFFFAPAQSQQMPQHYWFNWKEQLNSIVQFGKVTVQCYAVFLGKGHCVRIRGRNRFCEIDKGNSGWWEGDQVNWSVLTRSFLKSIQW